MHHSADSDAKRWLETLEKAIKGWSAYLRGSLAAVLRLPSFESDWSSLMTVLEELICMTALPSDSSGKKVCHDCSVASPAVLFSELKDMRCSTACLRCNCCCYQIFIIHFCDTSIVTIYFSIIRPINTFSAGLTDMYATIKSPHPLLVCVARDLVFKIKKCFRMLDAVNSIF